MGRSENSTSGEKQDHAVKACAAAGAMQQDACDVGPKGKEVRSSNRGEVLKELVIKLISEFRMTNSILGFLACFPSNVCILEP